MWKWLLLAAVFWPSVCFAQAPVVSYCQVSTVAGTSYVPCSPYTPLHVQNQSAHWLAVTPSDSVSLVPPSPVPPNTLPLAVFNGNGTAECSISVKSGESGATAVMFSNIQPGEELPISPAYVMSTNTTCTGIVALYP